jgi:hypothetical protein
MSRYQKDLRSGGSLAYGYDPPLAIYFFQVLDKDGDAIIDNNCQGIELAGWLIVLFGHDMDDTMNQHVLKASKDKEF